MSPPTREEQNQALAALSGGTVPAPGLDFLQASLFRLRSVAEAQSAGRSWPEIGTALGMTGKEAKRHVKHLAAEANQALQGGALPPRPASRPKRRRSIEKPRASLGIRDEAAAFAGPALPAAAAEHLCRDQLWRESPALEPGCDHDLELLPIIDTRIIRDGTTRLARWKPAGPGR